MLCKVRGSGDDCQIDVFSCGARYGRSYKSGSIVSVKITNNPSKKYIHSKYLDGIQVSSPDETIELLNYASKLTSGILFIDPSAGEQLLEVMNDEPYFVFPGEFILQHLRVVSPEERARRNVYYKILQEMAEEQKAPMFTVFDNKNSLVFYRGSKADQTQLCGTAINAEALFFQFNCVLLPEERFRLEKELL